MNFVLRILFLLLLIPFFNTKSLALSDYQISVICQKKRNKSICIRNLRAKKSDLLKGNRIEIPVIPFKKK